MRRGEARPAAAVISALDSVAIFSVASAVVLLLGAGHRFFFGPFRVTMPDPAALLAFGMLVVVIRYTLDPSLPILPVVPVDGSGAELRAEKMRLAAPAAFPRRAAFYAVGSAAASLVWLIPHLLRIRHVPDPGDPIFYAWQLARLTHQVLNTPTQLFDGNILHPAPNTLTYADPTVLQGALALPFIGAGADPLIVSNVLLIATFPLCALAFFYGAWRLTGDAQAGCIAGILGGLSAFKVEHYSHLELQYFFFVPLGTVAVMRLVASPSWRTGGIFGAIVSAQWLACMYYGVMQFVFLGTSVLMATAAWGISSRRRLATAAATGAAIALVGSSITAVPFFRTQGDRGHRSIQEVRSYSAVPADYLAADERLVNYQHLVPQDGKPELQLFPGSAPLVLAAVGVIPPMSVGMITLLVATAVTFEGSLGTNGLLYDDLYRYVPPFRSIRSAARFAALVGAGLILLSAYGAARLLSLTRSPAIRAVVFSALAAGALMDGRYLIALQPYHATIPTIYSRVTPDMVLAEFPEGEVSNEAYMYFSTSHWARLINGHSAYLPKGYLELQGAMAHFPGDKTVLQRLREHGTTHITLNCRFVPGNCEPLLNALDEMPELERIASEKWERADVRLYQLSQTPEKVK